MPPVNSTMLPQLLVECNTEAYNWCKQHAAGLGCIFSENQVTGIQPNCRTRARGGSASEGEGNFVRLESIPPRIWQCSGRWRRARWCSQLPSAPSHTLPPGTGALCGPLWPPTCCPCPLHLTPTTEQQPLLVSSLAFTAELAVPSSLAPAYSPALHLHPLTAQTPQWHHSTSKGRDEQPG